MDILKGKVEEVKSRHKMFNGQNEKFQLSKNTTEKNTKRVDAAISAVQETQENLTTRQEFLDSTTKPGRKLASVRLDKLEEELGAQMAELRRA